MLPPSAQNQSHSEINYPETCHDLCFMFEDHSFWFQHRNECIKIILNRFKPEGLIVDVGGGNGYVAQMMAQEGYSAMLVEPSPQSCQNAKKRGFNQIVCSTLDKLEIQKETVGAVGLFDVLEHLNDDSACLSTCRQLLKKNGKVFITVPAHSWLWSGTDNESGHLRRYTVDKLKKLFEAQNFEVLYTSFFFGFLLLPMFFLRRIPYLFGFRKRKFTSENLKGEHLSKNSSLRFLINPFLKRELNSLAADKLKFGTSIILVAEKR